MEGDDERTYAYKKFLMSDKNFDFIPEGAKEPQGEPGRFEFVENDTPPPQAFNSRFEFTQEESADDHGFLQDAIVRPAKAGVKSAIAGITSTSDVLANRETAAAQGGAAISSSGPSATPQPYQEEYAWTDLVHPSRLLGKTVYGAANSFPEIGGGVLGGLLASQPAAMAGATTAATVLGAPAAPYVAAAVEMGGIFTGAAVANAAKNIGPYFKAGIDAGLTPDEAFNKALKDATRSGAVTGISYAAFELAPFRSGIANLLYQAFGVQPGIAVAEKLDENRRAGKPLTEGTGQAYAQAAAGTAAPMIAAHAKESLRPLAGFAERASRAQTFSDLANEFKSFLNPKGVSPEANEAGGVVTERRGERYQREALAKQQFHDLRKFTKDLSREQQLEFMYAMEDGRVQPLPALQPVADSLRNALDSRRDMIRRLGQRDGKLYLDSYIENYLPHLWEDPKAARQTLQMGSSSLAGNASFLKHREIEFIKDGIKRGLKLKTYDPVTLAMARIHQMDYFIFGRDVWQDLKDRGFLKFVKDGGQAPEGYVRVEDRISHVRQYSESAKGFVDRGDFWAPESVNTILSRINDAGLRRKIPVLYQSLAAAKNLMNAVQLGFSAFHVGFEMLDVGTSQLAQGVQDLTRGRWKSAAKNLAIPAASIASGFAIGPAHPLLALAAFGLPATAMKAWKGENIKRAYLGKDKPFGLGPYGAEMQKMVDQVVKSGAKVTMPEMWKFAQQDTFWRQMNALSGQGNRLNELQIVKDIKFFPRLAQTLSAPLMEHLVPNVKLGVFADMARGTLESDPHMTSSQLRDVMQAHWASVENRLGELNMDHMLMPKWMVDTTWLALRSPGWKIGTLREIGGSLPDAINQVYRAARGRGFTLTDRMAYSMIAMPVYTMLGSAMYQYLKTGQMPDQMIDYIYPKDGGMDRFGQHTRSALPSYLSKDVFGWAHDPSHEAVAGTSPLAQVIVNEFRNEDYRGAAIHDPRDPWFAQRMDDANEAITSGIIPFSLNQKNKRVGEEDTLRPEAFFGITDAPAWASQTGEMQDAIQVNRDRKKLRKREYFKRQSEQDE